MEPVRVQRTMLRGLAQLGLERKPKEPVRPEPEKRPMGTEPGTR